MKRVWWMIILVHLYVGAEEKKENDVMKVDITNNNNHHIEMRNEPPDPNDFTKCNDLDELRKKMAGCFKQVLLDNLKRFDTRKRNAYYASLSGAEVTKLLGELKPDDRADLRAHALANNQEDYVTRLEELNKKHNEAEKKSGEVGVKAAKAFVAGLIWPPLALIYILL